MPTQTKPNYTKNNRPAWIYVLWGILCAFGLSVVALYVGFIILNKDSAADQTKILAEITPQVPTGEVAKPRVANLVKSVFNDIVPTANNPTAMVKKSVISDKQRRQIRCIQDKLNQKVASLNAIETKRKASDELLFIDQTLERINRICVLEELDR